MIRVLLPVVLCATMAGCAALPKSEDIKQFGKATSAVNETFATAVTTTRKLGVASAREKAAERFILGRSPHFPKVPEVDEIGALSKLPRQLLGSIAAYGNGLASAADTGVIADLESAAAKLGASVGGLVGAAGGPVGAKVGRPVGNVFARILGRAAGQEYIENILAIVRATHPAVVDAASLLKRDLPKISGQLRIECAKFPGERKNVLQTIQRDRRIDRLRRWELYRASAAEIDAMLATCRVLRNFPGLLDKMVAAHQALLKPSEVGSADIDAFVAAVTDIADLVAALK